MTGGGGASGVRHLAGLAPWRGRCHPRILGHGARRSLAVRIRRDAIQAMARSLDAPSTRRRDIAWRETGSWQVDA
jgi:hypothetical protein